MALPRFSASASCLGHALYPSYFAALPVGGAALVLVAGVAHPRNAVASLLSTKPLVGIGLISYGWYLWHWPLISLARIANFGEYDLHLSLAAGCVAFLLAIATYYAVERPAKKFKIGGSRKAWELNITAIGALAAASLMSYGHLYARQEHIAATTPPSYEATRLKAAALHCVMYAGGTMPNDCLTEGKKRTLVLGDSYALFTFPAILADAQARGLDAALFWTAGCPPFPHSTTFWKGAPYELCQKFQNQFLQQLEGPLFGKFDNAIIVVNWHQYANAIAATGAAAPEEFEQSLGRVADETTFTVSNLLSHGIKRLLLVGSHPFFRYGVTPCVVRATAYGIDLKKCGEQNSLGLVDKFRVVLEGVVAKFRNAHFIESRGILMLERRMHALHRRSATRGR